MSLEMHVGILHMCTPKSHSNGVKLAISTQATSQGFLIRKSPESGNRTHMETPIAPV